MFRLVTNFDHWHPIYESEDCSEAFKVAPFGADGVGSFPSVTLATSPQGLGERQFVVILVVDRLADLWSLEAVFRLRVGSEIHNIFSADNATRRQAVTTLKEIAESVDRKVQAHRKVSRGNRTSETMRFAAVALAGFAVGVGILAWVGSSAQFDSELTRELLGKMEQSLEKSRIAATQSQSALHGVRDERNAFAVELAGAVAEMRKQVNDAVESATASEVSLRATLQELKKDLAKAAAGHSKTAAQYVARAAEHSRKTHENLTEVRALIERLRTMARSSPTVDEPALSDVAGGTSKENAEVNK